MLHNLHTSYFVRESGKTSFGDHIYYPLPERVCLMWEGMTQGFTQDAQDLCVLFPCFLIVCILEIISGALIVGKISDSCDSDRSVWSYVLAPYYTSIKI